MSRAAGPRTANRPRTKSSADDGAGDVRGQRCAGAAAELFHLRQDEPADFGDDPGADGEVGAAQAEYDQRRGNSDQAGDSPGQDDRGHGVEAGDHGEREQRVSADTDEGLLPDRYQAGVAGKQNSIIAPAPAW